MLSQTALEALLRIVREVSIDPVFGPLVQNNTKEDIGVATEEVARRAWDFDSNWGLLSKSLGEKQFNGHAIDAVIHRGESQVVDIWGGAGSRNDPEVPLSERGPASAQAALVPKRPGNNWMMPVGTSPIPSRPAPTPAEDPRLRQLEKKLEELVVEVRLLKETPFPKRVALKLHSGLYVCEEDGGTGRVSHHNINFTYREAPGPWETIELIPMP